LEPRLFSPTQQDVGIDEKSFKETLINIIPENIFDSMANADMLALIFFSIVFGIFITKLDTSKKNLFD
jgi:proton glutamate symport protein